MVRAPGGGAARPAGGVASLQQADDGQVSPPPRPVRGLRSPPPPAPPSPGVQEILKIQAEENQLTDLREFSLSFSSWTVFCFASLDFYQRVRCERK